MNENKGSRIERFTRFMGSKGFYIVLFLCVAVIGVSAWVLTYTMNRTGLDLSESLSETLNNTRITAKIPSPTFPLLTAMPNEDTIAPPLTEQPLPEQTVTPESVPEASENEAADYYDYDWYSDSEEVFDEEAFTEISAPSSFIWPVSGNIETPFSIEALIYSRTTADWRTHPGIDITAALGAKVMAVAAGTVESVYDSRLYGTTVVITHGGGLRSIYSNLAKNPPVSAGDSISLGDVIGSVGQTAIAEAADVTHLHFEMTFNEINVDPVEYLPNR